MEGRSRGRGERRGGEGHRPWRDPPRARLFVHGEDGSAPGARGPPPLRGAGRGRKPSRADGPSPSSPRAPVTPTPPLFSWYLSVRPRVDRGVSRVLGTRFGPGEAPIGPKGLTCHVTQHVTNEPERTSHVRGRGTSRKTPLGEGREDGWTRAQAKGHVTCELDPAGSQPDTAAKRHRARMGRNRRNRTASGSTRRGPPSRLPGPGDGDVAEGKTQVT